MHNLGHTRSDRQPTHLLQTPDTFVGMPLPGFDSVTVIVHAAPAIGAAFTQYTAEFEPGGSLGPAHGQRFLYVLEGAVSPWLWAARRTSLPRADMPICPPTSRIRSRPRREAASP
jgi:glyoxylate utilization-related uncharacterized protein